MATKWKKMLAIALAIILCVNLMLLPVVALDTAIPTEEPTTVEATIIPPTTTTEPGPDDPQDANSITTSGSDTTNTWVKEEETPPVEGETWGTDEEGTGSSAENNIDAESTYEETDTQYSTTPPPVTEENTQYGSGVKGEETLGDKTYGETSSSEVATGSPLPEGGVTLDMTPGGTDQEKVEVSQEVLNQLGTSESKEVNGEAVTSEGTVTEGNVSYGEEKSEGYQEIPALQEQVGKDPVVTDNADGSTTSVSVTNTDNVYQRTTTTTKTVDKADESVDLSTLSEAEQKALQEKLGIDPNGYVDEETITNYLTKNEQANTETVEYEYQYVTDATGQIISITQITRTYDGTGADRKLLSVETDVENASTTKIITTTTFNPVTQWLEVSETTVTTIVEEIKNEKFTRTNTQEVQRVDTVTQNYTGTETTITLKEDEIITMDDGKQYFVFEGKMYAIENYSSSSDFGYVGDTKNGDTTSTIWNYDGGVVSGSSNTNTVLMKVVSKDGRDTAYVYCVEKNVNLSSTEYNWWDFFGVDPDYVYSDYNAVAVTNDNLRIVAENGYWNNAEGTKTLEQLRALDPSLINLTEKEAVAATQFALWHFSDGYNPNPNNSRIKTLYNILVGYTSDANYESPNAVEISASTITGTQVELLEQVVENNVPTDTYKANVTIKMDVSESKLVDGHYIVELYAVDENGNKTGDSLGKYRLPTNGAEATWTSNFADDISGTQVAQVVDGGYVLNGVVLPNGQKFNIQITGEQSLLEAVRFTDNRPGEVDRQDLMGIRTATREVNLVIPMEINVATGNLQKSETGFTQTGTTDVTYNGTKTWTDERNDETVTVSATEIVTTTKTPVAYETMSQSGIVSTTVQKLSNRLVEYGYPAPGAGGDDGDDGDNQLPPPDDGGDDGVVQNDDGIAIINDDGVPLDNNPQPRFGVNRGGAAKKGETIIEDEDVPLADAPKTGDASTVMAAMSLASLAGLMVLSRKKEEGSNSCT